MRSAGPAAPATVTTGASGQFPEPIAYNGTGTVNLSMVYFNDSEECYDGTQIYLKRADTDRSSS